MNKLFELVAYNDSIDDNIFQTLKLYEIYKTLFIFSQKNQEGIFYGNQEKWKYMLEHALARDDFNPLEHNGLLVSICCDTTQPQYIQDSVELIFKKRTYINWNISLCIVLYKLRNHTYLQQFIQRINNCPVSYDVLYKIVKNDSTYKDYINPEQMHDAQIIALYVGSK